MLGYIFNNMTATTVSKTLVGKCAFDILEDEGFQKEWDALYESCSWATIFQKREFVHSWYRANIDSCTPILLTVYKQGTLIGLLALTTGSDKDFKTDSSIKITGAGQFDAEYQVWLAKDEYNELFIQSGFEALFREFPQCKLSLRFVPNSDIIAPIKSIGFLTEKHTVFHKHHRPLMDFSLVEEQKLFRKRHLKAKYNRIQRAGKVEFVKIDDPVEFMEVLEEILVYLDFRQAAMFNKLPSKSNPNRNKFLLDLFQQDILHVTALKLDGKTISSIIGMKGKGWMHLAGLISYSPFHSKHSPGLVHLFMLGQMLQEEGFAYFDLTPGDDGYKERVSTSSDEVVELHLSKNFKYGVKKFLRKNLHYALLKFNIRPMSFQLEMKKKAYLLKKKTIGLSKSFLPGNGTKPCTSFSPTQPGIKINRNSIPDLMKFKEENGALSKWEFLENAFNLVSRGNEFYSITNESRLMGVVWIQTGEDESKPEITLTESYFHGSFKLNKDAFCAYVKEEANKALS